MSEASKLCGNCKTERYGIYCRGLCRRCYRLTIQKEEVERWDLKNPATLKRLPSICGYHSPMRLQEEFPKIKAERLRELECRLWLLKIHEEHRCGKVDGLDIEHALRHLAEWCGGKEDAVYGIASAVTCYFGPEARRMLLGWLLDIEESMRWNPRRYWHALNPEEVQEMLDRNRENLADFDRREGNSGTT